MIFKFDTKHYCLSCISKYYLLVVFLLMSFPYVSKAQDKNAIDTAETGVAVSPANIHFNAKPGTTQTKTIKVSNDTRYTKKLQVSFSDYRELNNEGQTHDNVNSDFKYALSKWLTASPTYVEVPPRGSKIITITLEVPNDDTAAIAAWTMITIDQVKPKKSLDLPKVDKNMVGMGVNQEFGFGVYVYQNPPNVINNKVEINSLKFIDKVGKEPNKLLMGVKNSGDGIGFCNYYVELTNLNNGKTDKITVKRFTILPGYSRELKFDIPGNFPPGKYSSVAVLDFGSKDDLQTAELEFEIK